MAKKKTSANRLAKYKTQPARTIQNKQRNIVKTERIKLKHKMKKVNRSKTSTVKRSDTMTTVHTPND